MMQKQIPCGNDSKESNAKETPTVQALNATHDEERET